MFFFCLLFLNSIHPPIHPALVKYLGSISQWEETYKLGTRAFKYKMVEPWVLGLSGKY